MDKKQLIHHLNEMVGIDNLPLKEVKGTLLDGLNGVHSPGSPYAYRWRLWYEMEVHGTVRKIVAHFRYCGVGPGCFPAENTIEVRRYYR